MIVLDASATVELLLGTARGRQVAALIADPDETLHAPHLMSIEVASVLRRLTLTGELTPADGQQALVELVELGVETYEHEPLLHEVFRLRDSLTAYDAAYVALAEALQADLLTCDAHLARSPAAGANIVLVDTSA